MFVKIGNRHINMDNVTFIEQQDSRYEIHFVANELRPLYINSGVLNDSSYSDLRAFLKSQAGAAQSEAAK